MVAGQRDAGASNFGGSPHLLAWSCRTCSGNLPVRLATNTNMPSCCGTSAVARLRQATVPLRLSALDGIKASHFGASIERLGCAVRHRTHLDSSGTQPSQQPRVCCWSVQADSLPKLMLCWCSNTLPMKAALNAANRRQQDPNVPATASMAVHENGCFCCGLRVRPHHGGPSHAYGPGRLPSRLAAAEQLIRTALQPGSREVHAYAACCQKALSSIFQACNSAPVSVPRLDPCCPCTLLQPSRSHIVEYQHKTCTLISAAGHLIRRPHVAAAIRAV